MSQYVHNVIKGLSRGAPQQQLKQAASAVANAASHRTASTEQARNMILGCSESLSTYEQFQPTLQNSAWYQPQQPELKLNLNVAPFKFNPVQAQLQQKPQSQSISSPFFKSSPTAQAYQSRLPAQLQPQNKLPVEPSTYFETEEEAINFEEAHCDAPVPDHYLQQMNTPEVAAAETPLSESVKYSESFKVKYKTEMCKNWESTGHCEFQASCSFAHGSLELKQKKDVPKNYKTKLCKRYHKTMYCPYGVRCQFLHGEVQNSPNDKPLLSETLQETTMAAKKPRKQVQEIDLYSELRKVNLSRQTSRLQIFQQITEPN